MLITAGNQGTVTVNSRNVNFAISSGGSVTINGESIETSGTLSNRYKNGTASPSGGNTIKYGSSSTKPSNPNNGDIYLQYS